MFVRIYKIPLLNNLHPIILMGIIGNLSDVWGNK